MFYADDIEVYTDEASFLPVSALNELRREAIDKLEKTILDNRYSSRHTVSMQLKENKPNYALSLLYDTNTSAGENDRCVLWKASVKNMSQLFAVLQSGIKEIILDWDLFAADMKNVICSLHEIADCRFYLRLPEIIRQQHYQHILHKTEELLLTGLFSGVYCTCIDALGICNKLLGHTMLTKEKIYGKSNPHRRPPNG